MKCLIIAAGIGSRLRNKGNMKPLIELSGIPLIERVVVTAMKTGISEFYVVVGYRAEDLKKFLINLQNNYKISITTIENLDWKMPNGISVLAAKNHIKEKFILTMTDHIYDTSLLEKLKKVEIKKDEVVLAVDFNIKKNQYVDIIDVTKVHVENGFIKNIGKEIVTYNAFDTGVFYCSPEIFSALDESCRSKNFSLSDGIKLLADKNKARVIDVTGSFWIDVDDQEAFNRAEELLRSGG